MSKLQFPRFITQVRDWYTRLMPPAPGSSQASIRRHLFAGIVIVLLLGGGVGGWAATTELAGALIAEGSIVVDSNIKKVQHPTGGIVGELRAHDGDHVKAGDILVRLDETVMRANLAIVTKGLDELMARKARLEAERDGAATVKFPPELLAHDNHDASCDARRGSDRRRSCSKESSNCSRKLPASKRNKAQKAKRLT
jgi:membrane fusion protein, type I secretion system